MTDRVRQVSFTDEEETELQQLVRKIKYNYSSFKDMERADFLTRKKWKSQAETTSSSNPTSTQENL